jgi:hypothetical protein
LIRECRDVAWWDAIASHPEVAPHVFMGMAPMTLEPLVSRDDVLALRSENGGVLYVPVDHCRTIYELHTMYHPDGWGREVAKAARSFMAAAFELADMVITYEQEDNWRSKPPRSHGWASQGDYRDCGFASRLRLWTVSKDAWLSSPIGRQTCPQ